MHTWGQPRGGAQQAAHDCRAHGRARCSYEQPSPELRRKNAERYGAAPTVPASNSRTAESSEISPRSSSSRAAAYLGRPGYSVDIKTDPVWGDDQDLALQHGWRSCWSTPIRNSQDTIIGTYAILQRTAGMPTHQEIEQKADYRTRRRRHHGISRSARLETRNEPVERADLESRGRHDENALEPAGRQLALAERLELKDAQIDRYATRCPSDATAEDLRSAAETQPKTGRQHYGANRQLIQALDQAK